MPSTNTITEEKQPISEEEQERLDKKTKALRDEKVEYGSSEHFEHQDAERARYRERKASELESIELEKQRRLTFEHKIAEADKAIIATEEIRDSYNFANGITRFITYEKSLLATHVQSIQEGLFSNMPGLSTIANVFSNLVYIISTTIRLDKKGKFKLEKIIKDLFTEKELEYWLTFSLKSLHKIFIDSIPHNQQITPLVSSVLSWVQSCESLLNILYNKSDYFAANMKLCDNLLFEVKNSLVQQAVKSADTIMQEQEAFLERLEQDHLAAIEATKAVKKRQIEAKKERAKRQKAEEKKQQIEQAKYEAAKKEV